MVIERISYKGFVNCDHATRIPNEFTVHGIHEIFTSKKEMKKAQENNPLAGRGFKKVVAFMVRSPSTRRARVGGRQGRQGGGGEWVERARRGEMWKGVGGGGGGGGGSQQQRAFRVWRDAGPHPRTVGAPGGCLPCPPCLPRRAAQGFHDGFRLDILSGSTESALLQTTGKKVLFAQAVDRYVYIVVKRGQKEGRYACHCLLAEAKKKTTPATIVDFVTRLVEGNIPAEEDGGGDGGGDSGAKAATLAIVLHAFEAKNPQELSVRAGEVLDVFYPEPGGSWWKVANAEGAVGCVPDTCVQVRAKRERAHDHDDAKRTE